MEKLLKKAFHTIGLQISKIETNKNNTLREFGIPKHAWRFEDEHFYIPEIDLSFTDRRAIQNLFFYYAKRIYNICNGKFEITKYGELLLHIEGITFTINDKEELYIINEVFADLFYNLNVIDDIVVIDIGQNVGISSLYFASKENVKKVYGFELFPDTFNLGQININNNPILATKIISKSYGLGKEDRELTLEYSSKSKGRMSIYGLPNNKNKDIKKVNVFIKDVYTELKMISKEESNYTLACKMDCEGAEYEILERLFEQKAIGLMDIYLIEWHKRNPDYLVDLFVQNGFKTLKTTFEEEMAGMIYAFK